MRVQNNNGQYNKNRKKLIDILKKGYTDIHQILLEKIFASETITSYEVKNTRWYVCQYNAGHFIHYYFQYTASTVNVKIKILPHSKQPEQS